MKIKIKVEFTATLESFEHEDVDSLLDEFVSECDYKLPSTDNINVIYTELTDSYIVANL